MRNRRRGARRGYILIALIIIIIALFVGGILLLNHYYPTDYVDIIMRYADMFDVEPVLIFAIIHAESRFNANAVSRVGASGLMQIMEDTAYWIAPMAGVENFSYDDIFDPAVNIRLGTFYISTHIARYDNLTVALSAYNAGRGNVERWLNDSEFSSDGVTLDHIPFAETRTYVERVNRNIRIYNVILNMRGIH